MTKQSLPADDISFIIATAISQSTSNDTPTGSPRSPQADPMEIGKALAMIAQGIYISFLCFRSQADMNAALPWSKEIGKQIKALKGTAIKYFIPRVVIDGMVDRGWLEWDWREVGLDVTKAGHEAAASYVRALKGATLN